MTSAIGTAVARAPRSVRIQSPHLGTPKRGHCQLNTGEEGHHFLNNAAEAICFVEAFVDRIQWPSAERETQTAVLTLCWNLKAFGPQLEIFYKEQLDRAFRDLCNACRNDKLDKLSRLHILEVIELRAGRWAIQQEVTTYYQSRIAQLQEREVEELSSGSTADSAEGVDGRSVQTNEAEKDNIEARDLSMSPESSIDWDMECGRTSCRGPSWDEYEYTINIGTENIRIMGQNYEFVKKAKLILDEYFRDGSSPNSDSIDGGTVVSGPQGSSSPVRYDRETLLFFSSSLLCQYPPPHFKRVVDSYPEIVRNLSNFGFGPN